MDEIGRALAAYAREASDLAGSPGSTEATFYPAVQRLLTAVLQSRQLPFDVRVNTSQRRSAGGTHLPDLAFYDGAGDFVVVFGEVKTPAVEMAELAASTERNDQIGRYLFRRRVALLSNVRAFGLLTVDPAFKGAGPVPPDHRRLLETVDIWPSASALVRTRPPDLEAAPALAELVETAVTEFAAIAEPESLARILARQVKRPRRSHPPSEAASRSDCLEAARHVAHCRSTCLPSVGADYGLNWLRRRLHYLERALSTDASTYRLRRFQRLWRAKPRDEAGWVPRPWGGRHRSFVGGDL